MLNNFSTKANYWFDLRKFLMVGLDIEPKHIPEDFQPDLAGDPNERLTNFICHVANLTAPHCLGWKPNLKFYEGSDGRKRLEEVCEYIGTEHPAHILLGDNKDGDIGNTNKQAMDYYINTLKLDAITLNPLMGFDDSMSVFLSNPDVAGFLLCLTSNKGSADILKTEVGGLHLYTFIAGLTRDGKNWNKNGNLHLVVGATNTVEQVGTIRAYAGDDAIFLMPGFGAQDGNSEVLKAARNNSGTGFFGVVARDIIAPKLQAGESFDAAVVRQATMYSDLFKG